MSQLSEYRTFLKAMRRVLRRASPQAAPPYLAENMMRRILARPQAPRCSWAPQAALAFASLAVVIVAWQGVRMAQRQEPVIVEFTADKTQVAAGEAITLKWQVRNAKKILIKDNKGLTADPGEETSLTVLPSQPGKYSYTLIALGPNSSQGR